MQSISGQIDGYQKLSKFINSTTKHRSSQMEALKNEKFQAQLSPVLIQRIKTLAEEEQRSVSQITGFLLKEALEAREANKTQG